MASGYPEVKCYVDSCHYWQKNNYCRADAIEVDNRWIMGGNDMEIGVLSEGSSEAAASEGTCCRTFKPRKKQGEKEGDEEEPGR
ncbi:MAG: DUF1540 domain-containing protein [Firmicutes bacterium]|jgi:hypothetical protein|nr:DUF1540 domain-containing protein [Bacillota bacterium]